MIDDLLHRFGHLGVSTATPRPLDETRRPVDPNLLSTQQLKERGWSATMITKLLPTHDATRPNQREVGWSQRRLTSPVKLYQLARVEAAEATPEYATALAKAERRRKKKLLT